MADQNPPNYGPFLAELFSVFKADGVCYCVLRNWQALPQDCGNDLDLFVEAASVGAASSVIISLAAAHGFFLRHTTKKYGYRSFDFFGWKSHSDLKIDLFSQIHFRGLEMLSPRVVLANPSDYKGIAIANESVANFVNSYKDVLDTGRVKEKYREEIAKGLLSQPGDTRMRQYLVDAFGADGPELIARAFAGGCNKGSDVIRRNLRRRLHTRRYRSAPIQSACCQVRAHWLRLIHRKMRRRSERLTIALLGPDGAGKSTVSAILQEQLIPPNQEILYRHGRPGRIPELRDLVNFVRRAMNRAAMNPNPKGKDAVQGRVHSKCMSIVYLLYYSIDFWLDEVWFRVSGRQCIRVFDRYWYDYFFLPSFVHLPKSMNLFLSILPAANVLLVLRAEPEIIYARKNELTIEQLREQNDRATKIARMRSEAHIIRTDGSLDQLMIAVATSIGSAR